MKTEPAPRFLNLGLDTVGSAFDKLDKAIFVLLPFSADKEIRGAHQRLFAVRLRHAIQLLLRVHNEYRLSLNRYYSSLRFNIERVVKLLHVTPSLLQSSDGRICSVGEVKMICGGPHCGNA